MIYLSYIAVFLIFYWRMKSQVFVLYSVTAAISAVLSLIIPEPYLGVMYSIAIISELVWFYKVKK